MANLTIRDLDESIKALLLVRAAHNGNSIEEEAKQILQAVLLKNEQKSPNLAEIMQQRFASVGGIEEIPMAKREAMREPPQFE